MSITTPNFSVTQADSDPSYATFTDTSIGSDVALTERRIYVRLANGNYLTSAGESTTEAYEVWAIGDVTKTYSFLPRSEAPLITVNWMTGATVSYTKAATACFDFADYIFALGLTMAQVANNNITQDNDWYANKMKLLVNIKDAENAILYISDTTLAQNALDRNYNMISKQQDFFGR